MKKSLFALICSVLLISGCTKSPTIEKDLAGTYKGELDISVNNTMIGEDIPQKVYISTSASDGQLKLELKNFSFADMNLGNILIDPCLVSEDKGTYTFTGSNEINFAAPIGSCQVIATGTIKDGVIAIIIEVEATALNQDVLVKFDGTKLSGTESTEAKITAFTFENPIVTEQPVINDEKGTITFKVSGSYKDEDIAALTPKITISKKAIISPATDIAQDFSAGKSVVYTVTAEDGTSKNYTVSIDRTILYYSFDQWAPYGDVAELPLPTIELASSSQGAALLAGYGKGIPLYKTDDKIAGNYAAKLVTVDLAEEAGALVPAITAGSVFTGKFDLGAAFTDRLACTQFGIPYNKKPLRFSGWYKYTPGTKFLDGSNYENIFEVVGKLDECAISAVLFKVDSDEEFLNGHDINNSSKRVAVAVLSDGTAKAEYTKFDLPFVFLEGKSYEAGAKYKIAIVCSSSKEGDTFKGAGGSTLFIDELQVIGE